jgi:hypothetical protein
MSGAELNSGLKLIPAAHEEAVQVISRHALPLGVKPDGRDFPWEKVARATFTLLRLQTGCFFITCDHVFRELRELQKTHPGAEIVAYLTTSSRFCELSGFRLIARDERPLDVAIFAGLDDIVELPGLDFIDYHASYLEDPLPGEGVSIVGYPSDNITVTNQVAEFGRMHIGFTISSVSYRYITLANERGDRQFLDYNTSRRSSINLGGMSGSPAFVIRNHEYRFVGIVTECHERDRTIVISRLGCINPDGTLDYTKIPC